MAAAEHTQAANDRADCMFSLLYFLICAVGNYCFECIINVLLGGRQNVGIRFDFVKEQDGAVSFYCVKKLVLHNR